MGLFIMKKLLSLALSLSLLFSANFFCADDQEPTGLTYEDILWSYSMPGLE